VRAASTDDEVARALREAIAAILPAVPAREIDPGKHLRDLGADSIDRVEIILHVMERLGVDEPLASFSDIPSIGALLDFLGERMR
jgi:polyketide biosynthesis acyl carrier protein